MALTLAEKKAVVEGVASVAANSISALAADYRGLTVSEMTELRRKAREVGVHVQVVRNTLTKRALKDTQFECMNEALLGSMCLAFCSDEPGAAAKLFRDFSKDHDNLTVKALSIGGKLLDASKLDAVASLPTKEEALTKLVYVMKAPVTKFVRTLAEPYAQMVRVFGAVAEQKKQAA